MGAETDDARWVLERQVPMAPSMEGPDGLRYAVRALAYLSGPEPSSPAPPPAPRAGTIRPHGTRRGLLPLVHQVDGAKHPPHALRRRVACRQPNCPSSVGSWRAGERRARRAIRASRDRHASACRSLTRSVSRSCHNAGCTVSSKVWARVPGRSPSRIVLRRRAAHQAYALSLHAARG